MSVTPDIQFVVYYKDEHPETIWKYVHHPKGDFITDINGNVVGKPKPYAELYGFWNEERDKNNKVTRKFIEHTSTNRKLISFEHLVEKLVPDKSRMRVFDSEEEFFVELL